jgi:hypothetical protein
VHRGTDFPDDLLFPTIYTQDLPSIDTYNFNPNNLAFERGRTQQPYFHVIIGKTNQAL